MEKTQFQQRAKVGVAGSFFNQLMSNNHSIPEVGKGATEMHYTDRSCFEVIEVSQDGKIVKLEALEAEWDKTKPGGQGHQNWILKPTGHYRTVQWRHNAWRVVVTEIEFTKEFEKEAEDKGGFSRAKYLKDNYPEVYAKVYDPNSRKYPHPGAVVEGFTREVKRYHKINILFGQKNYYYDWEF